MLFFLSGVLGVNLGGCHNSPCVDLALLRIAPANETCVFVSAPISQHGELLETTVIWTILVKQFFRFFWCFEFEASVNILKLKVHTHMYKSQIF